MNPFVRLVFLLLAIATIAIVLVTNGHALVFLDVPGFFLVTTLTALGLCASFGPGLVLEAFVGVVRRTANRRERALHARVWRRAHGLAWGSGVLASAIGIILQLANLEHPETLLPSFGMCLLPLFWSALYAELLFAHFEAWAEREDTLDVASSR